MGKRHLETAASSFSGEAVVKIEWLPYTLIEEGSQYDTGRYRSRNTFCTKIAKMQLQERWVEQPGGAGALSCNGNGDLQPVPPVEFTATALVLEAMI